MPLLFLFYAYLAIGLVFGLWFVFKGIDRLDADIHGSSWRARLMLLPGTVGLWPVLLRKLFQPPAP